MVVITPDVIEASVSSTPRARPQLTSFSNRTYTASPLGPNNRLSTPQRHGSPARRSRDDFSRGRLNAASTALRPAPAAASKLNVFAPGVSPSPKKLRASSDAPHTPSRGASLRSTNPDLFVQSIPDPPQDLTGEALSQHIPKHLERRGTVYADQYLSHLCPQDFGDEQRRQFFCILDLRRLKFAATEIFSKKDWRLNIMNFAKEFDKSRSMILLRYGLYEFKNVRPSADVLKKWRAAHNLPDPEDDASVPDGTRQNGFPTATKRKADDELTRELARDSSLLVTSPSKANKRRAVDMVDSSESDAIANRHKRKAAVCDDVEDELPSKLRKSQSSTRSFFESIGGSAGASTPTSKPPIKAPGTAPVPRQNIFTSADKPSLFASAAKPSNGISKSIFDNITPGAPQPQQPSTTGNIFGYLSESSANNSFTDPDSPDDEPEAQDAPASSEPGVIASGRLETETPAMEGGLFGAQRDSALSATATAQASGVSTPGRSLFDRIESKEEEKPAPTNQTWTAGTPIKFGTSTPQDTTTKTASDAFSFGSSAAKPMTSIFQNKSNLFGAAPATPAPIPTSKADVPVPPPMTAPPKTGLFGAKPTKKEAEKPATDLFGAKPAEADTPVASSAPSLSFSAAPSDIFGAPNSSSNAGLFQGSYTAPSAKEEEAAVLKSNAAPEKMDPPSAAIFGASNPHSNAGLFQGHYKPSLTPSPAPESKPEQSAPAAGLFGMSQPVESKPPTGLFDATPTLAATAGLFGASQPVPSKPETTTGLLGSTLLAPSTPKAPSKTATPMFSFGSTAAETKPAEPSSLYGNNAPGPFGSPMKTDESPSKKAAPAPNGSLFGFAASAAPASANIFASSTTENKAARSGIFSNINAGNENKSGLFSFTSNAPTEKAPGNIFGGTSFASTAPPGSASSSFTFGAGGAGGNENAGGQSFSNPFATVTNNDVPDSATSSFDFNFGGAPSAPTPGGNSSSFVFGAGSQLTPNTSGMFSFGGNAGGGLATPSGRKRGASPALAGAKKPFTASAAPKPSFSFTAATPQPAQSQPQSMFFSFGQSQPAQSQPAQSQAASSVFSNLQTPAGGASTTGANSPFVFGGSSVATTPAAGTPEPSQAEADGDAEPPQEQIYLASSGGPGEEEETVLHEIRAKALKYMPPGSRDSDDEAESKSPWTTQGLGRLRLLQNKETGTVRLLLRAEPRGHVALNRTVLAGEKYAAKEKYVTVVTSNESGTGLETWMLQVKTKEMASALAAALERHKSANRE